MMQIEDLHVSYSGIEALRGVSLNIEEGETVSLIGPNGAGKSTLLNTISGLVRPASGQITFGSKLLPPSKSWFSTAAGILQVPEGRQVFAEMSVLENLQLGVTAMHGRKATHSLDSVFSIFPILKEREGQLAGSLSGGQQQMLAIARGLMGAPKLLLLDEPSLGLAPVIIGQVFSALNDLKKAGLTILLVEQNANQALAFSDRAYVLEQGRIVHQGSSKMLANDPEIAMHYLGHNQGRTKQRRKT